MIGDGDRAIGRVASMPSDLGDPVREVPGGPHSAMAQAGITDAPHQVTPHALPALTTMPWDMRLLIFAMLPFTDFVTVVRVCKDWYETAALEKLGRKKISEMGSAVTGKDMLSALQPDQGLSLMRPECEGALLLSFARKTAHVALHDHHIVTDAWLARFSHIKSKMGDTAIDGIGAQIDALQWFAKSPLLRYLQCDGVATGLISAMGPLSQLTLSASAMTLILKWLLPHHVHSARSFCALDHMVHESAQLLWLEMAEGTAPTGACKPLLPLLRRYAWEWFLQGDVTTSVSDVLLDKFGVTLDVQRRAFDPYIAEKIVDHSAQTRTSITDICDRWRRDDAALIAMVEHHCLRQVPLDVLRGGGFIERYRGMEQRVRLRLWQYETDNESLFRGNALLGAEFKRRYLAVSEVQNMAEWHALWEASLPMPWYVAPLLMQHLTCKLCVLARVAFYNFDVESGLPRLFDDVIAWRDRVVPLCLAEGAFEMAARAYAAPLSVTCEPWRLRTVGNDRTAAARHVIALMDAARAGLATLSPRYWHEILETLFSRSLPLSSAVHQGEWIDRFLRSPVAIARYPSTDFVSRLSAHAVRIWPGLPDCAIGTKTRFAVFCERFDLVGAQREQLYTALIDDIYTRVFTKASTLDDALRDAGFQDDIDMVRCVEQKLWHRALRGTTSGVNFARAEFVQNTRGSAFLRNQAAVFLAGTTETVTLEPV